jgi:hypothetical protein
MLQRNRHCIGEEAGSPPPSSHTTGRAVPHPAVHETHWSHRTLSSNYPRFRPPPGRRVRLSAIQSHTRVPPWFLSVGSPLPCLFCFHWLSTCSRCLLAMFHVRPFSPNRRLIWPLLTSGSPSRSLSTTVAQLGRLPDLPGYDAQTFTLIPVGYTSQRSVQVPGFDDIRHLTPLQRLLSASCSSGQRFAFGFLQIHSHLRHPCRSADSSPCRASSGLSPPSLCALPGAQMNYPAASYGVSKDGKERSKLRGI